MGQRLTTKMLSGALLTGLLLGGAAACSDDDEDSTSTGDAAGGEDTTVFDIAVGDCLVGDPTASGEVSEVPTIDCAQPHGSEVFHTYDITTEELPAATELEGIVQEQCIGQFQAFIGMPYEQSAIEVTWLEPTAGSWEEGDRELVCMVTDPAGDVTGSLAGVNR